MNSSNASASCDLIESTSLRDIINRLNSSRLAMVEGTIASTNKSSALVLDALESASFAPPPCDQRSYLYTTLAIGVVVLFVLALMALGSMG